MKLRVEYFWNDDVNHWSFMVPSLHVIGGGQATREEVERAAMEAIEFTLEGVPKDFDDNVDEVVYFDVRVTPAKVEAPAG